MQHREKPPLPVTAAIHRGWLWLAELMPHQPEPLLIVHVQHPADGGGQPLVVGPRWTLLEAGLPAETRPATAASPVEIVEIQSRLLEKLTERAVAESSQLGDQPSPVDS